MSEILQGHDSKGSFTTNGLVKLYFSITEKQFAEFILLPSVTLTRKNGEGTFMLFTGTENEAWLVPEHFIQKLRHCFDFSEVFTPKESITSLDTAMTLEDLPRLRCEGETCWRFKVSSGATFAERAMNAAQNCRLCEGFAAIEPETGDENNVE